MTLEKTLKEFISGSMTLEIFPFWPNVAMREREGGGC